MSLYDYQVSRKLTAVDPPFDSLIMAAIRKADNANARKLQQAFPRQYRELHERYDAPGGILPGEEHHAPQDG